MASQKIENWAANPYMRWISTIPFRQCLISILKYISTLSGLQLSLQGIRSVIKWYYLKNPTESQRGEKAPVPYLRSIDEFLGLTGDNSPKKRIVEHRVMKTYSLPFLAFFLLFWFRGKSLLSSGLFSLIGIICMRVFRVFTLLKVYSESGMGFNLYFEGWRVIGLDYHSWVIKQDPKTGKPLSVAQQYTGPARFHIDIPGWDMHHWPHNQHTSCAEMEKLMTSQSEKRAEKQMRKDQKKEQRRLRVEQRKTVGAQPNREEK